MCGITGGISLHKSFNFAVDINRMNNSIAHRGPDSEGIFIDENSRVCFGHRRLAILDLSELGKQPLTIDEYTITYNGEIYNYLELRNELESLGVNFISQTDTEVILQSYIYWGESCINKFNGMWAFAIYNPKKQEVFCSRDRFGIKPFFYTVFDNRLYFASEIKAFLQIKEWESKLNISIAYDFLAHSLVSHTNETFLNGVFDLRGGHNLKIDLSNGNYSIYKYYSYEYNSNNNSQFSEKEHLEYFEQLFKNAVKLSLRSDVKVGSALSGGLDSSTIVSIVNTFLKTNSDQKNQECVSAIYSNEDKGIDESEFIDILSNYLNLKVHKTEPNWEHLMTNLDKLIWHQDEPFPTLSIYAQYSVFEIAANNNLKVMLDGQGADEIFAGYESFYEGYFKELISDNPLNIFQAFIGYVRKHKKFPLNKIAEKIFLKSNFNFGFRNKFSLAAKPFIRQNKFTVRGMSEDYLENFGLHSLLKYEDRNSMTFSVESRVPFLDYRVVEYALNLKTNLKIKNGIRKFILRESFRKILPDKITSRYDKLGFPTPQERWTIENSFKVESMLIEALNDLKDLFDIESFLDIRKRILNKDKVFIFFIWRIIIFSRWRKQYNVQINF
jgi:asparagine synthase (glutamine-hydrolysing)